MTEGLKITRRLTWRLRHMIVERGINTAAELSRRLGDIGFNIHPSQVTRVLKDRPVEIKTDLLDALLEVLQCNIEDILRAEPVSNQGGSPSSSPASSVSPTQARPRKPRTAKKLAEVPPTPAIPRVSVVPLQVKKTGPKEDKE